MSAALPPLNFVEIVYCAEIWAAFYLNGLAQWHDLGHGFREGAD